MKKFVALVLALMLCLSLCACGGTGASSPEEAVENAFAKYDNTEDMYTAIGVDYQEFLMRVVTIGLKDADLENLRELFLKDWPDIFTQRYDSEGDKLSSLIGFDKLGEYRAKIENAETREELAEIHSELVILYLDTYLEEIRAKGAYESCGDDSVIEKVDQISVNELTGSEYDSVYAALSADLNEDTNAYLYTLEDVEAIYSAEFVITFISGNTRDFGVDDGWYVVKTSEGYFVWTDAYSWK